MYPNLDVKYTRALEAKEPHQKATVWFTEGVV